MWGYAKENGPSTWHEKFPVAAGESQSPININVDTCKSDDSLKRINVAPNNVVLSDLSNTGASWKAQVQSGETTLTGGPLGSEFVLEQFHCHWGRADDSGSEHTINGTMYAAELHLVFWNKDKFKSFGEAAAQHDGLAVLGMFLKVGREHAELAKVTKLLPFIKFKGQAISVPEEISPTNFLPHDLSYWTYQGSLTTPPCYESVNWIVFEQPIEVSREQITIFRNLKSYHPCEKCPDDELRGCMFENYRPPCPLNNRSIRTFKDTPMEE